MECDREEHGLHKSFVTDTWVDRQQAFVYTTDVGSATRMIYVATCACIRMIVWTLARGLSPGLSQEFLLDARYRRLVLPVGRL